MLPGGYSHCLSWSYQLLYQQRGPGWQPPRLFSPFERSVIRWSYFFIVHIRSHENTGKGCPSLQSPVLWQGCMWFTRCHTESSLARIYPRAMIPPRRVGDVESRLFVCERHARAPSVPSLLSLGRCSTRGCAHGVRDRLFVHHGGMAYFTATLLISAGRFTIRNLGTHPKACSCTRGKLYTSSPFTSRDQWHWPFLRVLLLWISRRLSRGYTLFRCETFDCDHQKRLIQTIVLFHHTGGLITLMSMNAYNWKAVIRFSVDVKASKEEKGFPCINHVEIKVRQRPTTGLSMCNNVWILE